MTTDFKNECRIALEKFVVDIAVNDLLADGYAITVNNGESNVLFNAINKTEIIEAMFSTDEDFLYVSKNDKTNFIHFVYGNSGYDVISDYNTALETVLIRANSIYDKANERDGLKISFSL